MLSQWGEARQRDRAGLLLPWVRLRPPAAPELSPAATTGASNNAAQAALAGPERILLTVILGDLD